jgi:mycothiol synthase
MSKEQPQLRMKRTLATIPETRLPAGYTLRTFEPADAEAWANLMARNGELGEWSPDRAETFFAPHSHMPLEGAFFVTADEQPVATAQTHLNPPDPLAPSAELGWVAVDPAHRGRGLAVVVCLAVMRHAANVGHSSIFLLTDDWRLPAIWTYLKLGFEPWMTHPSHPGRWRAVHAQLAHYRRSQTDK